MKLPLICSFLNSWVDVIKTFPHLLTLINWNSLFFKAFSPGENRTSYACLCLSNCSVNFSRILNERDRKAVRTMIVIQTVMKLKAKFANKTLQISPRTSLSQGMSQGNRKSPKKRQRMILRPKMFPMLNPWMVK